MVSLGEAKIYLRVDSDYEDGLISSLIRSAEAMCMDIARLSADEWEALSEYDPETSENPVIRQEELDKVEAWKMKDLMRIGVMYALGYMYEHREEADYHDLAMTLRNVYFSVREGVF